MSRRDELVDSDLTVLLCWYIARLDFTRIEIEPARQTSRTLEVRESGVVR